MLVWLAELMKHRDAADSKRKYNRRDDEARQSMRNLIDSDANKVINVFSTLL